MKNVNNFRVKLGDIAIDKVSRKKVPLIEVVMLSNPDNRCLLTYDTCQFVGGNIPESDIPYIIDKVKKNKKFVEV